MGTSESTTGCATPSDLHAQTFPPYPSTYVYRQHVCVPLMDSNRCDITPHFTLPSHPSLPLHQPSPSPEPVAAQQRQQNIAVRKPRQTHNGRESTSSPHDGGHHRGASPETTTITTKPAPPQAMGERRLDGINRNHSLHHHRREAPHPTPRPIITITTVTPHAAPEHINSSRERKGNEPVARQQQQ